MATYPIRFGIQTGVTRSNEGQIVARGRLAGQLYSVPLTYSDFRPAHAPCSDSFPLASALSQRFQ